MTRRPPHNRNMYRFANNSQRGRARQVLVLACAGVTAGATWVVDDDGGADRMGI